MPDKYIYLLIDIGSFIVPFIFSYHPKLKFNHHQHAFWKANLIVSLIFISWDVLFTWMGVWGFNKRYVTGLYLLNLPIEEILFFICIPYSSVFTYHCLTIFFKQKTFKANQVLSVILIILLLFLSFFNYSRSYSVSAFGSLAVLIFYVEFVLKSKWLSHFYIMYLIILIPFFIVNGLLTGTGLDEPVVIYNNNENMGLRLLSIPFEDVFYGMSLLLMNTSLYEYFKDRK